MYLHWSWSVLLLAAVVGLYWFVIRPRLKVCFLDTYTHLDSFWERVGARMYAFRSYIATVIAAILIAAPDIVVAVLPVDLSGIVGPKWAPIITATLTAYLTINRALATKAGNEPA